MKKSTFGEFLRKKRQQCGLSQYQLGLLLEVSDRAVSKWENDLARPKSKLLYQLSVILGVTVDELLCGGERSDRKKEYCLIEERYEHLWNKTYHNLMERYTDSPPVEIISRFEIEKLALMNTDMILFFDLLSRISKSAQEKGYPIQQEDSRGASFVAYLSGASDINPLSAHYYCPVCKKVEFVSDVSDGWELPPKYCENCHTYLVRDGHNIPFELYCHVIGKNAGFNIVVSRNFYEEAEAGILNYFSDYMTIILKPPAEVTENRNISEMVTYVIQTKHTEKKVEKDSLICSYEEYYEFISGEPYINLLIKDDYEKYMELTRLVGISVQEIDFLDERVQQALPAEDISGILNFGLYGISRFLKKYSIGGIKDLLQLYGIALCASSLSGYETVTYMNHQADLSEAISYRDDVFLHICSKMKEHGYMERGFALRVMNQTRKGIYYRNGVDRYTRKILLDIGVSERYIACLEQIPYLFPKALGITQVRYTMILLWYRIYHPKEFQHVIGERYE